MKRFPSFLGVSLGLLSSLSAALVACVTNTSATPSGGEDAGFVYPGEDAALPGQDATIPTGGEDGGTIAPTDGAPPPDAPQADAGPKPLTLRVLLGTTPKAGVTIVFQSAAGAVLSTATTDATGAVSQLVDVGTQVTALLGTAAAPNLVTIQGVEPGDVLTFVDPSSPQVNPNESVAVTAPAPTWDASDVSEYFNAGNCGDPAGYPVYLETDCFAGGAFPLLARATSETGQEVAFTFQKQNPLVPDGGVPDGGEIAITITAPWQASSATQTITTSGLPVGADGNTSFTFNEIAEGVPTPVDSETEVTSDAGALTSSYPIHQGFADFVQTEAYSYPSSGGDELTVVAGATRSAAPTGSAAFDLSTLPFFSGASVDTTDGGTAEQPLVAWTTAGSFASAAGFVAQVQYENSATDDAGSTNYTEGTWTIVAPPTAVSVQVPALPAAMSALGPLPGQYVGLQPRVVAVKGTLLPGYGALRGQFAGVGLFGSGYSAQFPVLPVDQTVIVSAIYPNEG